AGFEVRECRPFIRRFEHDRTTAVLILVTCDVPVRADCDEGPRAARMAWPWLNQIPGGPAIPFTRIVLALTDPPVAPLRVESTSGIRGRSKVARPRRAVPKTRTLSAFIGGKNVPVRLAKPHAARTIRVRVGRLRGHRGPRGPAVCRGINN